MFSIIIPLYNKAPYIQRAIESVVNQSFMEYEIIVVNDGSIDGGDELVKNQYADKVTLINQKNQGVSVARNRGIEESKHQFIAFLDADDCWHEDYLFWMAKVVGKYPDAGIFGSTYTNQLPIEIKEDPEIIEIKDYFKQADYNTLYTSSSTVIRKDFFENNEGFKKHLTKGEDLDVWFRAVAWFEKCYYVKAPLLYYDLSAASGTRQLPSLERTIFSEILSPTFLPKDPHAWQFFKERFLLLNLWMYFENKNNWLDRNEFLSQTNSPYFLAKILYSFPFTFWKFIHKNPSTKLLLRKYLKFCFRYVYA